MVNEGPRDQVKIQGPSDRGTEFGCSNPLSSFFRVPSPPDRDAGEGLIQSADVENTGPSEDSGPSLDAGEEPYCGIKQSCRVIHTEDCHVSRPCWPGWPSWPPPPFMAI